MYILRQYKPQPTAELRSRRKEGRFPVEQDLGTNTTVDDARTLYAAYDSHGERHRRWRKAVKEPMSEHYQRYPIEWPLSCLAVCTHFERHGGTPRMWLAQWLRDKRLESTNCVARDLRVLLEVLQKAWSHDQLSFGGVTALEVVTEAHAKPQKPNGDTPKISSRIGGAGDAVIPGLRQCPRKRRMLLMWKTCVPVGEA